MTDNEIIKALEGCINNNGICEGCPLLNKRNSSRECTDELIRGALALINRQKAEIEGWKEAFNNLDKIARPNLAYVENAKSEAIREFAKFIIDKSKKGVIYDSDIPDYVKEMVGEDK